MNESFGPECFGGEDYPAIPDEQLTAGTDAINPAHYKSHPSGVECWRVAECFPYHIGVVPLCGCGSSDELWGLVRDILGRSLDITDAWDKQRAEGVTSFARVTGFYDSMGEFPALAVEFAAHVLSHVDLLEHGSSVQCAWLTAPGKLVLLFLRKFGCDSQKWPEWADSCSDGEEFFLDADGWRVLISGDRDKITEASIPDGEPRQW